MSDGYYTIEELRAKGVTVIGTNVLVSRFTNIYNAKNLTLHNHIRIDDFTVISCKGPVEIMNYVHIGPQCMISSSTRVILGNYVGLSCGVKLFGGCDDFSGDYLTNPTVPSKYLNVQHGDIILEDHSLIGANSVILPGVVLKQGATIAASSLVKKDVDEWTICGGCPAKKIKDRSRKCLELQSELEAETNPERVAFSRIGSTTLSTQEIVPFIPEHVDKHEAKQSNKSKKTIFITGGSKGIGKAIATHFLKLEYDVVISYNKSADKAAELKNYGIDIYKMDVTNLEECAEVTSNIFKKYGKLDILVNNAGILNNQLFHKMTPDQWSTVISTNVNSLYNVTHPVIKHMLESGSGGKIVNISSIYGLKGSKGQTNYAASKHAVVGFTKSLALEYGDKNVLVNCICPGLVDTDMLQSIHPKVSAKIVDATPLKKVIDPVEIARACEFFAKSEFCTGTALNLDCGMNC